MSWIDEVLHGRSGDSDTRKSLDEQIGKVRAMFDSYLAQGMYPDEARLFTQHTFNRQFDTQRDALSFNQALTDDYIMDRYLEEVEDD